MKKLSLLLLLHYYYYYHYHHYHHLGNGIFDQAVRVSLLE